MLLLQSNHGTVCHFVVRLLWVFQCNADEIIWLHCIVHAFLKHSFGLNFITISFRITHKHTHKFVKVLFTFYIYDICFVIVGSWKYTKHIIYDLFHYIWLTNIQRRRWEVNHLIRMHLVGAPSAPTSLNGKQWSEYIPASTPSSFSASTGIISWKIMPTLTC